MTVIVTVIDHVICIAAAEHGGVDALAAIDDIEPGDLVVHYEYGIGKFKGIVQEEEGEELQIEYKDGSILSVPLEQAHLLGKYIGVGGKTPDLNKLGNATWQKNRKSAEKSILDYAARLLRIQAEREHDQGHAHPPDTRWMFEFEQSFHYTETPDQKQAILDTKHDLEAPRPMDRLICGDVGFGKTEVAIRAAFKAITGGKQVALLCPTTVLAEQHWRTFRERFSDYPIRVDLLNRFRSAAEVRATVTAQIDALAAKGKPSIAKNGRIVFPRAPVGEQPPGIAVGGRRSGSP